MLNDFSNIFQLAKGLGRNRKLDTISDGIRTKACVAQRLTTKEFIISKWSIVIYHLARRKQFVSWQNPPAALNHCFFNLVAKNDN